MSLMQAGWYGFMSPDIATGASVKPVTVCATAAGPRFVQVTVSPAWMTICEWENSLMDRRVLSGLPPASTCQTFVPSGFDSCGGLDPIVAGERQQVRLVLEIGGYFQVFGRLHRLVRATTSMRPLIVGPSTRLMK